jgi:hypothetical protein
MQFPPRTPHQPRFCFQCSFLPSKSNWPPRTVQKRSISFHEPESIGPWYLMRNGNRDGQNSLRCRLRRRRMILASSSTKTSILTSSELPSSLLSSNFPVIRIEFRHTPRHLEPGHRGCRQSHLDCKRDEIAVGQRHMLGVRKLYLLTLERLIWLWLSSVFDWR